MECDLVCPRVIVMHELSGAKAQRTLTRLVVEQLFFTVAFGKPQLRLIFTDMQVGAAVACGAMMAAHAWVTPTRRRR